MRERGISFFMVLSILAAVTIRNGRMSGKKCGSYRKDFSISVYGMGIFIQCPIYYGIRSLHTGAYRK